MHRAFLGTGRVLFNGEIQRIYYEGMVYQGVTEHRWLIITPGSLHVSVCSILESEPSLSAAHIRDICKCRLCK